MKYLSLQQAMLGMRVTMTDDGVILKSPAGSAHYDLKGRRHTVKGNAEFLPMHLRVKDKRKPDLSRVVFEKDCTIFYRADGNARVRIGNFGNQQEPKGFRIHTDGPLTVNHGQAFINNDGKEHAAGMAVGVEGENSKVEFLADRYKVHEVAQSASNNEKTTFNVGLSFGGFPGAMSHDKANPADGNNATKTSLNDEMCEAIISAVRESDLFAALQAKIDAQTASVVGLQQAMHKAVNDALRNALKPGGILWNKRSSGL
ncbi:hypothetical protein [Enterobacter sp.]|uniref:hypothetical protein n=1 Tax=Enterobacter sp. TaxID=42895 RepID=UPI002912F64A|nr:hypothetical protein [Enterobacter sp.]MDU4459150.1 hypothetical protein [Enterobacter sp.]